MCTCSGFVPRRTGPKYNGKGFERLLDQYFDDNQHMSSALTSIVIPAFDTRIQQPIFFSSWKVCVLCVLFSLPLSLSPPNLKTANGSLAQKMKKKTLTTMSALYVGFMVLVVLESAIADKGGSVVGDNAWHVLGVQAKRELLDNAPMKYVCQATAAAPTYLPPVDFILTDPNSTPPVSRAFNLIDGGVAVSNPVSIQILIIKAFRFLFFSRTVQAIQPCMYRHTHDQFFCFDLFTACFFLCVFLGVLG